MSFPQKWLDQKFSLLKEFTCRTYLSVKIDRKEIVRNLREDLNECNMEQNMKKEKRKKNA